ncbi:MAG: hypothetical protein MI976_30235 [Pseudomonadales bacterium]|nr:hypothetical protein [Pseudomonadales bacterium]
MKSSLLKSIAATVLFATMISAAQADLIIVKPEIINTDIINNWFVDPDYKLECNNRRDEKRSTIYGNLTLESAADIEKFRCIRRVTGNLYLDTDNQITLLTLPWLERVDGNLWLKAGAYFEKGKFPKLTKVNGDIIFYNRYRTAYWWMPALTEHNNEIEVIAGVYNDLTGFTHLTSLHQLYLHNHPNDIWGPFNFSGLDALTEVDNIEYYLRQGQVNGSFLTNLTQVNNNVEIYLNDSQLFGLNAIETIAGRFILENTNYTYHLNNLSNLTFLGGLELVDNASLNNISQLNGITLTSGGLVRIVDNSSLSNCDAKQLTRDLRNAPNWSNFNGNHTYVYNNGYPDCL